MGAVKRRCPGRLRSLGASSFLRKAPKNPGEGVAYSTSLGGSVDPLREFLARLAEEPDHQALVPAPDRFQQASLLRFEGGVRRIALDVADRVVLLEGRHDLLGAL